ncbi:hypothetical protein Enr13x_18510 [Stieleria neptunia]|uniref:Alpha/beta hydrolase family protein n=2 Tax=Stieleria neptunia TaxID=2527979 RepID=A0A518HME8_9BACT|nr:hypothetical protein Enr13x_18510 [Stieleria neptunia]
MLRLLVSRQLLLIVVLLGTALPLAAQAPPYDVIPQADPPYYRVRYDASEQAADPNATDRKPGELIFPVSYTIWIPPGVNTLRGVVVHQHGCGEGSCKSGLTGAFDLHWQALAKKHDCALLAPAYEQPQAADCQMWCDPRNGSVTTFEQSLVDLGNLSGHPELASAPLALWGHSGGGHWCGGMVMIRPNRVVAAWLRSGVPLLEPNPDRPGIKPHTLPEAALGVPMMCNPGTKEGVTVKDGRFAGVWPANLQFFDAVRGRGGLLGIAIDPLTAHECGNQRYLAIPWLDRCLELRLPKKPGGSLRPMPTASAWLAEPTGTTAVAANDVDGDPLKASWLPDETIATLWIQYRKDTRVADSSPPPPPKSVQRQGNRLRWQAEADLQSGIEKFIILRNGKPLAEVPSEGTNRFGRPIFQGLQYSDTPTQPLVQMEFVDQSAQRGEDDEYSVVTVNTAGLESQPTQAGPALGGD